MQEKTYPSIHFCFLVTSDLSKEAIWIKWLNELVTYNVNVSISTHCSYPERIKSEWLKRTLLPKEFILPTQREYHTLASMSLYKYAFCKNTTESAWFSLHSETCVPIIPPSQFAYYFHQYQNHSFLDYCKIWWDPLKINRANLHFIPEGNRYAHQEWCILCKKDMKEIIDYSEKNKDLISLLTLGPSSDESIIAVLLSMTNRFENVICKRTTLVDWERSPNGNNPYTFITYSKKDEEMIDSLKKKNEYHMFLRKVDSNFPDKILLDFISPNS